MLLDLNTERLSYSYNHDVYMVLQNTTVDVSVTMVLLIVFIYILKKLVLLYFQISFKIKFESFCFVL